MATSATPTTQPNGHGNGHTNGHGKAEASDAGDGGLRAFFDRQQRAFLEDMNPSRVVRLDRLDRLQAMIEKWEDRIVTAISDDFGNRSAHETRLAEFMLVVGGIRHARRHLAEWMRPRRVATALHFLPGSNRLIRQPLGVVGIVSPWNYPLQLALAPLIPALAAGNRALIKPSELTPRFSELLREMVAETYPETEVAVVTGDAQVGRRFVELPFDHLLFTGSTQVGRMVAEAAARNLTPVTLELGGKSPAILDLGADFAVAAPRIVTGKLLNAGQTCIAPDYLFAPANRVDELVAALRGAIEKFYPTIARNRDYTSIVSDRHHARLRALLDDAKAKGARVIEVNPGNETLDPAARKLAPAIVLDVTDDMRIMQEEIFGPLLPIMTYQRVEEPIRYINRHERPLALYWFGEDDYRRDQVLEHTVSGGVTINDCLWHIGQEDQPFGGVGKSGTGAYHGERGFLAFSHEKPVFNQPKNNALFLLQPPYGKTFERVVALLRRVI